MRKLLSAIFAGFVLMTGANAADVSQDMEDPLYLQSIEEIVSRTTINYWDNILRAGQTISYGMNNRLTLAANVHFQQDFDGSEDGFSAIDLGGVYRLARADDNESHVISDVLFGLKFGGSSHVRTPYFADSTYYAGLRFGRQWAGMTLSGTVQSNWIFDDERGMAYIDFVPEIYFRVAPDWRLGGGMIIRKATNPYYDQEWIDFKVVRQYGRTQWVAHMDFEFESDDVQVGGRINILF